MVEKRFITRRDFLRGTAGAAVAAALGGGAAAETLPEKTARVVLIRDRAAVGAKGEIESGAVRKMLDEAVAALLGEADAAKAWGRLVASGDTVGVKSNAWPRLPTPPELEEAIRLRVRGAGVPENNIGIDDRGVLRNPVFRKATALINVRPLRTHHWSGVGTCLKNYIMFVPDPASYHDEGCSPLGKIWTHPEVRGKTRLNILAALTPQFFGRGAHSFDRRYVWPCKGLIVGTDPVAVDAVGAHLLQTKRIVHFGEDRSLDVPPVHIEAAEKRYGLGVSDLKRIQVVKLGWAEEILI